MPRFLRAASSRSHHFCGGARPPTAWIGSAISARGARVGVEQRVDAVEALDLALGVRPVLAAVAVRRRDRVVVGAERLARRVPVLLVRRDLERAQGQSVVAVLEVRDLGLLAELPRHLERDLVGLRAAGREERLVDGPGRQADQLLGEPDRRDRAVLAGDLQHVVELPGDRLDDPRVAVAGVVDEVPGREVEVLLAVDVGHRAAARLRDDHRLAGRVRPGAHHVLLVGGFDRVGVGYLFTHESSLASVVSSVPHVANPSQVPGLAETRAGRRRGGRSPGIPVRWPW